MARQTKVYKITDHQTKPSSYLYICAYSKQEVATILNRPYSHISNNMSQVSGTQLERFAHLKHGDTERDKELDKPTGISTRDLDRIASVGFVKSAMLALDQCNPPTKEMRDKLYDIVESLKSLKGDMTEEIEREFRGR
ncbi:hypothetical protein LMH73_002655 [Vibrio splendidus]|nr:hypothetical protein [Vibrio splendidus]MCC4880472.1 hypothetical protein [Vibrio splendidus]